ncbi:hypothetical protein RDV84_12790 [Lysobacter yananisis]|uniref:Uncharacterized protein n=1 Tax=Lysobacter yananisis TaxID=1003114 RepID=A0ABY9PF55_9GAMM|nr:hypothetical protein [Lysobacter yananisis]WMT05676.1 hypothetical protein RDV84_12790 [Lysobacter yananisis]
MVTYTSNDDSARQRAFDIEAERCYWMENTDLLPNADMFSSNELNSAVSLGIDSAVRGRLPADAEDILRATYYRLVNLPMMSWSRVLTVISAVYQRAIFCSLPQVGLEAECNVADAAPRTHDWQWVSRQMRLRFLPLQS